MYECGRAKVTGWPSRRPSAMSLRLRCDFSRAPARSASTVRTICPALCLVPAYSGPGLPSPTMIQRSSDMSKPQAHRRGASTSRPAGFAWWLLGLRLGRGLGLAERLRGLALGRLALFLRGLAEVDGRRGDHVQHQGLRV